MSVALISFCSFLSGVGSCAAFQAALKTGELVTTQTKHMANDSATLNWPTHRGSATACPLAAFGLSAFFYTVIAGFAFPGDTSSLLMFLSLATSLLVLVAIPFLIVVDHQSGTSYSALPTTERARRDSNILHRTKASGTKFKESVVPQPENSKCHLSTPQPHLPMSTANQSEQTKMKRVVPPPKNHPYCLALETSLMIAMRQVRSRLTHTV
jgi:hypothetical protein